MRFEAPSSSIESSRILLTVKVSTEEATRFAKDKQMGFYETSAKINSNVDEAFGSLVEGIVCWIRY